MRMKRFRMHHLIASIGVLACLLVGARRGAANAPQGRYEAMNGGVHDTKTGLTWQEPTSGFTYNWAGAAIYCGTLDGGTWRLPSMQELQTIVDDSRESPAIDPTAFPSASPDYFWTASPYVLQPGNAWFVYFDNGYTYRDQTAALHSVRCVQ